MWTWIVHPIDALVGAGFYKGNSGQKWDWLKLPIEALMELSHL
jgi:hypothetical protein